MQEIVFIYGYEYKQIVENYYQYNVVVKVLKNVVGLFVGKEIVGFLENQWYLYGVCGFYLQVYLGGFIWFYCDRYDEIMMLDGVC